MPKQKIKESTEITTSTYKPKPSVKDEVIRYLSAKGYHVELKDGMIYGLFNAESEYTQFRKTIIDKFGDGKSIPFSFGGRIGDISQMIKSPRRTEGSASEESELEEEI